MAATTLDAATKRQVANVLNAAGNPDHGKADVIVKSLPKDRQKLINKTAKQVKAISDEIMARGKKALEDMSDEEWDALVNE